MKCLFLSQRTSGSRKSNKVCIYKKRVPSWESIGKRLHSLFIHTNPCCSANSNAARRGRRPSPPARSAAAAAAAAGGRAPQPRGDGRHEPPRHEQVVEPPDERQEVGQAVELSGVVACAYVFCAGSGRGQE